MSFINFLHTYHPSSVLISFGPINIHWYGLLIVLGMITAIAITIKLASYYKIKTEAIIDLAFWLIISGVVGARIYFIFLELPYYLQHPVDMLKPWQGGLAIHGAIIGGIFTLWFYTKKHQQNFWQLAALITPGLALAQTIGRWGNYFNQELFGYPTSLPWGIPIDFANRPLEFLNYQYFQPTFFYESLGNLLIFAVLIIINIYFIKNPDNYQLTASTYRYELCIMSYAILYSLLRFAMEFIRIDSTPIILGLRFPQLVSLIIIILSLTYLVYLFFFKKPAKIVSLEK